MKKSKTNDNSLDEAGVVFKNHIPDDVALDNFDNFFRSQWVIEVAKYPFLTKTQIRQRITAMWKKKTSTQSKVNKARNGMKQDKKSKTVNCLTSRELFPSDDCAEKSKSKRLLVPLKVDFVHCMSSNTGVSRRKCKTSEGKRKVTFNKKLYIRYRTTSEESSNSTFKDNGYKQNKNCRNYLPNKKNKFQKNDENFDVLLNNNCSWSYKSQIINKKMEGNKESLNVQSTYIKSIPDSNKDRKESGTLLEKHKTNYSDVFKNTDKKINNEEDFILKNQNKDEPHIEHDDYNRKEESGESKICEESDGILPIEFQSNHDKTPEKNHGQSILNENELSPVSSSEEEIFQTRFIVQNKNLVSENEYFSDTSHTSPKKNLDNVEEIDSHVKTTSPIIIQAIACNKNKFGTAALNNSLPSIINQEVIGTVKENDISLTVEKNKSNLDADNSYMRNSNNENELLDIDNDTSVKIMLKEKAQCLTKKNESNWSDSHLDRSNDKLDDFTNDFLNGTFDVNLYRADISPSNRKQTPCSEKKTKSKSFNKEQRNVFNDKKLLHNEFLDIDNVKNVTKTSPKQKAKSLAKNPDRHGSDSHLDESNDNLCDFMIKDFLDGTFDVNSYQAVISPRNTKTVLLSRKQTNKSNKDQENIVDEKYHSKEKFDFHNVKRDRQKYSFGNSHITESRNVKRNKRRKSQSRDTKSKSFDKEHVTKTSSQEKPKSPAKETESDGSDSNFNESNNNLCDFMTENFPDGTFDETSDQAVISPRNTKTIPLARKQTNKSNKDQQNIFDEKNHSKENCDFRNVNRDQQTNGEKDSFENSHITGSRNVKRNKRRKSQTREMKSKSFNKEHVTKTSSQEKPKSPAKETESDGSNSNFYESNDNLCDFMSEDFLNGTFDETSYQAVISPRNTKTISLSRKQTNKSKKNQQNIFDEKNHSKEKRDFSNVNKDKQTNEEKDPLENSHITERGNLKRRKSQTRQTKRTKVMQNTDVNKNDEILRQSPFEKYPNKEKNELHYDKHSALNKSTRNDSGMMKANNIWKRYKQEKICYENSNNTNEYKRCKRNSSRIASEKIKQIEEFENFDIYEEINLCSDNDTKTDTNYINIYTSNDLKLKDSSTETKNTYKNKNNLKNNTFWNKNVSEGISSNKDQSFLCNKDKMDNYHKDIIKTFDECSKSAKIYVNDISNEKNKTNRGCNKKDEAVKNMRLNFNEKKRYADKLENKVIAPINKSLSTARKTWDMLEKELLGESEDIHAAENLNKNALGEKEKIRKHNIQNAKRCNLSGTLAIQSPKNIVERTITAMGRCTTTLFNTKQRINEDVQEDSLLFEDVFDNSDISQETQFHSEITFVAKNNKHYYKNEIYGFLKKSTRKNTKISSKNKQSIYKTCIFNTDNNKTKKYKEPLKLEDLNFNCIPNNKSVKKSNNAIQDVVLTHSAKEVNPWDRLMNNMQLGNDNRQKYFFSNEWKQDSSKHQHNKHPRTYSTHTDEEVTNDWDEIIASEVENNDKEWQLKDFQTLSDKEKKLAKNLTTSQNFMLNTNNYVHSDFEEDSDASASSTNHGKRNIKKQHKKIKYKTKESDEVHKLKSSPQINITNDGKGLKLKNFASNSSTANYSEKLVQLKQTNEMNLDQSKQDHKMNNKDKNKNKREKYKKYLRKKLNRTQLTGRMKDNHNDGNLMTEENKNERDISENNIENKRNIKRKLIAEDNEDVFSVSSSDSEGEKVNSQCTGIFGDLFD